MAENEPLNHKTTYPNNHKTPRSGLQDALRIIAVLAAVVGFFVAVFAAAGMMSTSEGTMVFAETYGGILSGCLTLWIAAAVLDALRVIAANSFRDP